MRVVYIHQYFNPGQGASGLRSTIFARRLASRGHDVHVVSSTAFAATREAGSEQLAEGVTVHWVDSPYSQKMSFRERLGAFTSFALKAAVVARRQRADLIFATSTPLTVIIPAFLAALGRRTPIVFEVRDLWPAVPVAIGALRSRPLIMAARALEHAAYRLSRRVIALSEGMREGVLASHPRPELVSVIPNMADTDMFGQADEGASAWRAEQGFPEDAAIVLYCGTLGFVNGIEYMAEIASEAMKLDPSVLFVVVGDGKEASTVAATAQRLGVLNRNFRMLGAVPKLQIAKIYASSSICTSFVRNVPAFEANSANKFFDALASGRPIAINHGGWQAREIQDAQCGLVMPATNAKAAALMLVQAIHDREGLAAMGRNGRMLAEARYSAKELSERFVNTLEEAFRDTQR